MSPDKRQAQGCGTLRSSDETVSRSADPRIVPQTADERREAREAGRQLGILLGLEDALQAATDPYGREPSVATIADWIEGRRLAGVAS